MDDIEQLGRYNIIRVLGKGAMGVVYEGRDPNLDRVVAIKTIRVQSLTPEAAAEYEGRFRTEARSAARLHHPNIVSVFDSGQDGDIAYLVMEFIEGEDLKQHLESGARFSVRSSIVMVHELLMALDHAHRQNVVHRDIKPANMLMEVTGRIKLTDFGVARIQEPDETNLTQVGGAVGTPKYMSPEQAKGLRGDSRSDVFSAAVVLYELLTGTLPFTGENQFIVIHQIVGHVAAPPSSLNPEVPVAMDEVIARAMAKDPNERYATAREFGLALRAVAQQMSANTGTQSPDVGAELGKFLANRPAAAPAALRDGSSTGIFGPAVDVALASTVNHEAELAAWHVAKDSTDPKEFLDFLKHFPGGIYARRAQNRIYDLGAGASLEQAKTEPQFRATADDSGFDSTVGHFAPTRPLQTPDQTIPGIAGVGEDPPVAEPVPTVSDAAPPQNRWMLVAAGAVVVASVVAAISLIPQGGSEDVPRQSVAPAPAPIVQPSAVATATPASAPTSAPAAVPASKPAVPVTTGASRVPTRPKTNAVVASTPTPQAAPPAAPVQQEAATSAANHGIGVGPSRPGQVCANEVFIFKIKCIADQCTTDRYRNTPECIRFKELERDREEQRNIRR
jgi:serine/threonine-protein kinase